MFVSSKMSCLKKSFACKLNCLKQNLIFVTFILLEGPLPFESVFLGVCAFETQLWQN